MSNVKTLELLAIELDESDFELDDAGCWIDGMASEEGKREISPRREPHV